MAVLGIETSCDETSAAVISSTGEVLSNIVLSQDDIHAPYGGIVPELASRSHIRAVGYVVRESLVRAGVDLKDIEAYAVTTGPGLIGSLLVGVSFAKGLAYFYGRPLIAVDHLEAHIHSAFIKNKSIPFPALALLVSGGHTSLFLMSDILETRLISGTRDDAAGEALDKVAKFLNLGYPGGPIIDKLAQTGDPRKYRFTLPRMSDGSLDFSFSGLKTAALKIIKENNIPSSGPVLNDFLASFQSSVVRSLLSNVREAVLRFHPRSLILSGGVARNRKLRESYIKLAAKADLPVFVPDPEFCTDNAAMIAVLGREIWRRGKAEADFLSLNAYARRPWKSD